MDWPTLAILFLGVAAIPAALLLTLQTWEFGRFVRSRTKNPKANPAAPPVSLFAPCKGLDAGLKDNLRPLFEQDYENYRLVFAVERSDDAACKPIRELMAEYCQVPARLIIAGLATASGQKVHNLLAATDELGDVELLAFVDSDARPKRDWLRHLVQHIHRPASAAATGYRWYVPLKNTLPNLVLHSLNAAAAALVGPGKHHMVWGGAWAIRRDAFDSIGLRAKWEGTLSDDLVAARELARSGKKLEFEPGCMTASPVDMSWSQMFEFVRRQYTVARFYTPIWWSLALVFCTLSQIAFWGGFVLSIWAVAVRNAWSWVPAVVSGLMYATYVTRATLRQNAAKWFLPEQYRNGMVARQFDIWLSPVAGLANWIGLLGSLRGNCITWRSVTYAIQSGGKICILRRAGTDGPQTTIPLRQAG